MNVIIVNESGYSMVELDQIDTTVVGQKAKGLLDIPTPWRLPFLCISSSVFQHYCFAMCSQEKQDIIKMTANSLCSCLPIINISCSDSIIVRSSGVEEGISERGRYESQVCSVQNLETTLTNLFNQLDTQCIPSPQMAFVVQKYISDSALGHLSNERRFSRIKREWVYELIRENNVILSDTISVRNWRTKFDGAEKSELLCDSQSNISSVLRRVAWYYTKRKVAIHFEFIWDGKRIILVQADPEKSSSESVCDPTSFCIKVNSSSLSELKVLRLVSDEDQRYKKVKNILLYQKIGLNTAPIYILNSEKYILELQRGEISLPLEEDLRALASNSVVVRLDIANVDVQERQLLPRSNEIRSYEQLKDWLLGQKEFLSSGNDVAFLFHVFIPAFGAAFVNATPTGRIVEIEALWGLPEGLYYNAHDKIVVDTKSINSDIISKDNVEILKKQPAYKEFYVAPDEKGQWIQKKTAQPYDWRICIDDDSIKQIAIESRKIAKVEQKSVSVMWFLGIDESYYKTRNLAWYHEGFSRNGYTASEYKKKYFFETETLIRNEQDFNNFVNNPDIKEVTIRPVDDALLRDKDFLRKVGEEADKKGATIILEGAVLAHPLYQLLRTGARVLTLNQQSRYSEESFFNKLVRDNIPDIITGNGEDVFCQILGKDALLRALMEKAVEEALEIASASSSSLIEELGDEFEVVSSILEVAKGLKTLSRLQQKRIAVANTSIHEDIIFQRKQKINLTNKLTQKRIFSPEFGIIEEDISFESARLQIEIHMFRECEKGDTLRKNISEELTADPEIDCLFRSALSLTSYSRLQDVKATAKRMMNDILKMVRSRSVTEDEFLQTVRKKREKRGGFSKGYMLKSSSLSQEQENHSMQKQLDLTASEYCEVSLLEFNAVKNADYLEKGKGELVLRISLPICFNEYQTVFESNTVKKYIGKNKIIVGLTRGKNTINLQFLIQKDPDCYSQMKLPL